MNPAQQRVAVIFRLFSLTAVVACSWSQTTAPLSFEVASIKPSGPLRLRPGEFVGTRTGFDRIDFPNATLRYCIRFAYHVHDFQISAPAWMDSVHYAIVAKGPKGTRPRQLPEMLQTLLAERFLLRFHRERKEFGGLALVVDNGGPKLHRAAAQPDNVPDGAPGSCMGSVRVSPPGVHNGRIIGSCADMAMLAGNLSILLGRPVTDMTQLKGEYDFTVEVSRDDTSTGPAEPIDGVEDGVSVYTSVKSLGLKLEGRKIPLDVIVVDHAERAPVEN